MHWLTYIYGRFYRFYEIGDTSFSVLQTTVDFINSYRVIYEYRFICPAFRNEDGLIKVLFTLRYSPSLEKRSLMCS